jgi:t-SNARE complex subunit (syntaxin)
MTTRQRRELGRLVGQIQTLTLNLQNLRQRELETSEVDAKERTLERLRRQLTAVAPRAATDELGNAA